MRPPRLTTLTTTAMSFIVLLVLGGLYQASVTVVDDNGHTLMVEVDYDAGDPSIQGLTLVDESPDGSTTNDTITPTWDQLIDKDPAIALDPYDGRPVVVWSRQDGSDFEIAMVRRLPGGWGPIDVLTNNSTSDISPRAIVDPLQRAHLVWYPSGLGGPVYLQSFDIHNGHPVGQAHKPLEPPAGRTLRTTVIGGSSVGGGDDPGLIGGFTSRASESPCPTNPTAAPDHGALLACGEPAAYQLSSCVLVVGVYDNVRATWVQSVTDLGRRNLSATSVRQIAQSLADGRCN